MNEALQAVLFFAFDELKLHRLEADVDPRNVGSIRSLEKLGFQREGYLRERWHVNGEIQDAIFMVCCNLNGKRKDRSSRRRK